MRAIERRAEEARYIKVRADKLDHLIDLIGELVIAGSGAQMVATAKPDGCTILHMTATAVVASAIRDGIMVEMPTDRLVRGDTVVLRGGGVVPADGRLVAASELMIERSSIDVSLSDIAQKSGVNAALVKYHFGNKDGR